MSDEYNVQITISLEDYKSIFSCIKGAESSFRNTNSPGVADKFKTLAERLVAGTKEIPDA